jgi:hypothetical protein
MTVIIVNGCYGKEMNILCGERKVNDDANTFCNLQCGKALLGDN